MNYISEFGKVRVMRKMRYASTLLIALAAIVGAQSGEDSNDGNSEECSMPPMLQNFLMPGSKLREMKSKAMEEMGTCLRLTPPKEMMDIMKTCMMNVFKSPEVVEDFKSDEKSVGDVVKAIRSKLASCHVEEYGFDLSGNDLNLEELVEKMELNKWVGTMKNLMIHKQIIENCTATVQGNTSVERLRGFEHCTHFGLIDHCEQQEEKIGLLPAYMSLVMTADDEPMCNSVQVPQEIFDYRMKCLKEAADGVDLSAAVEAEKSPLMKAYVLFHEYWEKVSIPFMECIFEKNTMALIDKDSRKFKSDIVIGFVKQLKGWDQIPQKRDELVKAMTDCSVVHEVVAPEQQETKIELYTRLAKQFMDYGRCFLPKFARTCGINNKLTEALFPMFHKDYLKTSFELFMKTGGMAAKEIMTLMKEKMGLFTM